MHDLKGYSKTVHLSGLSISPSLRPDIQMTVVLYIYLEVTVHVCLCRNIVDFRLFSFVDWYVVVVTYHHKDSHVGGLILS